MVNCTFVPRRGSGVGVNVAILLYHDDGCTTLSSYQLENIEVVSYCISLMILWSYWRWITEVAFARRQFNHVLVVVVLD